jgi:stearoyl-CoA desaturase (delta-9 desaturase)
VSDTLEQRRGTDEPELSRPSRTDRRRRRRRDGRDKATNFWPLALLSFGESRHNSHHADPTGARHSVLPGQIDPSARLIWMFERLGWACDVRWPSADRLSARLLPEPAAQQESAA